MQPVTDPDLLAILNGGAPAAGGPVYGPPPKTPAPVDPAVAEGRALDNEIKRRRLAEGGEDNGGAAIPTGFFSKIDPQVGTYTAYQSALDSFQDDFAGNTIIGGLENTTQRHLGIGTPGQAEWWSNFQRVDNKVRNELFGATLTPSEQSAYLQTTITPRMLPSEVRAVLESRTAILRGALERQRQFALANGYKPQAVDALFAPIIEQQAALAQSAGAAAGDQREAPPAFEGQTERGPPLSNAPFTNAEGQIAGNTHNNDDGATPQEVSTAQFRQEDDPLLAGVRQEYLARLQRGDDASAIIAWAKEAGVHPSAFPSIASQVAYRRANPQVPITEYSTRELDDRFVKVDPLARGISAMGQSGPGPFVVSAGDAFTGFNLDSAVGLTGGNAEQARLGMNQIAERNPVGSTLGMVAGGTAAALGGEAALSGLIAKNVPRALAADSLYGMVAGAGMTDYAPDGSPATLADRAVGAGKGGLAGLVGSSAGQVVGKVGQSFARGVSDPSVAALQAEGVPMTLGQMVGNSGKAGAFVKGAEDRVAGLPVVGDMINARRTEGVRKLNVRAFDKALEPIGGTIGDLVGAEAVEEASQQVQAAFGKALAGKAARADGQFGTDLTAASTQTLAIPRVGPELGSNIQEILAPYMTGQQLTGEAMQAISRELRALKAGYRTQEPALYNRIGKAIDSTEDAIFGLFRRQAPDVIPAYNAAKQAYRRVSILADAVNAADNQAGGLATPAQLNRADRANAKKYEGAISAAAGPRQFRDITKPAQDVLPNKVPDSGTAGRIILPLVGAGIIGGDAATGDGLSTTGLTLGTIVAGAYTKAGQRVLTKPARGMKGGTRRRAVVESQRTKRALGLAGAGSAGALTNQQ